MENVNMLLLLKFLARREAVFVTSYGFVATERS